MDSLKVSLGGSLGSYFDLPKLSPPFVVMCNPAGDRELSVPDEIHWAMMFGLMLEVEESPRFTFKVHCDKQKRPMVVHLGEGNLTMTRGGQTREYGIQWFSAAAQSQWLHLRAQFQGVFCPEPEFEFIRPRVLQAFLEQLSLPTHLVSKIAENCCRSWARRAEKSIVDSCVTAATSEETALLAAGTVEQCVVEKHYLLNCTKDICSELSDCENLDTDRPWDYQAGLILQSYANTKL
jgi:hypothetical protein